jgi:ankyrin repeat protein
MAAYSRKVGVDFLEAAVGDCVKGICENTALSFEINPVMIKGVAEAQKDLVVKGNQEQLRKKAVEFVTQITGERMLELMPREVRAIAGFTAEYARHYAADRVSALVGGFLMLRLVNPSLVTPDAYGFVQKGLVTPTVRRNLTLLSKVLQNLSNNVPFGSKEEYMTPMNSLIEEYAERMKAFYARIVVDERAADSDDADAWVDCKNPPTTEDFDPALLEEHNLLLLHKMLYNYRGKLLEILHEELQKDVDDRDFTLDEGELFFTILDELGAPPNNSGSGALVRQRAETLSAINFLAKTEKSGVIERRRGESGASSKKRRLWVVVVGCFLHLFASPQENKALQSLPIEDVIVQLRDDGADGVFSISYDQSTWLFTCQSQQEAVDWHRSILALKERRGRHVARGSLDELSPLEKRIANHLTGKRQPYECAFASFANSNGFAVFTFTVTAHGTAYGVERTWRDFMSLHDELVSAHPRFIFATFPDIGDPQSKSAGHKRRMGKLRGFAGGDSSSSSAAASSSSSPSSSSSSPSPSPSAAASAGSSSSQSSSSGGESSPRKLKKKRGSHKRRGSMSSPSPAASSSSAAPRNGDADADDADDDRDSLTASGDAASIAEREAHSTIGFDAAGRPTRGLVLACKFLKAYMSELMANFQTSQSDLMFDFLELNSPFRAVLEESVEHLQYLQKVGTDFDVQNREGRAPLHMAVLNESAKMIELLVRYSANINVPDKGGNTPLHTALRRDKLAMAELLLELGADPGLPNRSRMSPLHLAAEVGSVKLCEQLLDKGGPLDLADAKGRSALQRAVANRHEDVAMLLLDRGAKTAFEDRSGNTLLHVAVKTRMSAVLKRLVADDSVDVNAANQHQVTPLHLAARANLKSIVRALLAHADIRPNVLDKEGMSPAALAARDGFPDVLELLAPVSDINYRSRSERSTLHQAAMAGVARSIEILGEHGAKLNVQDSDGRTPLHLAIVEKQVDVIAPLLELCADPEIKDNRNRAPLHTAAMLGDPAVVSAILATKRANVNVVDDEGCIPLHLSIWARKLEVMRILIEAGSDVHKPDAVNHDTPLHVAAASGNADMIKLLVANQADPSAKQKDGNSPLHVAALCGGDRVMIDALIVGAPIPAAALVAIPNGKGLTPLQLALQKNNESAAVALVNHGASIGNLSGVSKPLRQALEAAAHKAK